MRAEYAGRTRGQHHFAQAGTGTAFGAPAVAS